jgi:hypothetical protein
MVVASALLPMSHSSAGMMERAAAEAEAVAAVVVVVEEEGLLTHEAEVTTRSTVSSAWVPRQLAAGEGKQHPH